MKRHNSYLGPKTSAALNSLTKQQRRFYGVFCFARVFPVGLIGFVGGSVAFVAAYGFFLRLGDQHCSKPGELYYLPANDFLPDIALMLGLMAMFAGGVWAAVAAFAWVCKKCSVVVAKVEAAKRADWSDGGHSARVGLTLLTVSVLVSLAIMFWTACAGGSHLRVTDKGIFAKDYFRLREEFYGWDAVWGITLTSLGRYGSCPGYVVTFNDGKQWSFTIGRSGRNRYETSAADYISERSGKSVDVHLPTGQTTVNDAESDTRQ